MPLTSVLAPLTRSPYMSDTTESVVTGANTRISMLPPDVRTGVGSFYVPANGMPIGAWAYLVGIGTIGARLTTPPGFNLVPWFKPDGGSKTDLPGFATAPLLGTDGTCEIWMKFAQTSSGLRTSGYVRYGALYGMAYSIPINIGATGVAGAGPTTVASSPTVGRTFGVDGFWGTGADSREYVKCRSVSVMIVPAM